MLEGTKCVARELRGAMRGLLVLEAVKYRRSDSYLTGLGGYFANVARSGLPMSRAVLQEQPIQSTTNTIQTHRQIQIKR